ncbi:hypothetical protein PF008_g32508, partial [Phytophthora fragariae]
MLSLPLDKQLIVAVKCISLPYATAMHAHHGAARALDDPLQECRVARLLANSEGGHANVVRSYFHFHQHDCLYLVAEYCVHGDLNTHLTTSTPSGSMDECTSVHFMRQILMGVDFLHRQRGIAHRDLSLGVMWFILLTGSPLVSVASRQNKAFVALEECGVAAVFESWKFTDRLSTAIVQLISQMLTVSPDQR